MNSPEQVTLVADDRLSDDCLSPVFAEIARSLQQIAQQLESVPVADADGTAMMNAVVSSLGQTEAAFTLAGVDSLAAITALAQRLVIRCLADPSVLCADFVVALHQAFSTLLSAMNRLLARQPVTIPELLPCWTALAARDIAGSAHPSALLSLQFDGTMLPSIAVPEDAAVQSDPRGEFERALLRFLRCESPEEGRQAAQRMSLVIAAIASRAPSSTDHTGWLVLHAATGLIAGGNIHDTILSKKILAGTGRIIRHLGPTGSLPVPASLIREALFAVATANAHTAESAGIALAFDLETQIPSGVFDFAIRTIADPSVINAASHEIQILITALDATGLSVLPTPEQLEPLVRVASQLSDFDTVTAALCGLQARLASNQVHSDQALAVAACLLSLQQQMDCSSSAAFRTPTAQAIAAALKAIDVHAGLPAWRTLHQMGIALQTPSVMAALTQALSDSLNIAERQAERLIDEPQSPAEHEAALIIIERRLSEVQSVLCLLGESATGTQVEKMRDELRRLITEASTDPDQPAYDRFAQLFVRLSAHIIALPRLLDQQVSNPDIDAAPSLAVDDEKTVTPPVFDTDHALHTIFLDEAAALICQLRAWFPAEDADSTVPFESAAHAAHALAGCSATVGLSAMRQLAMAMEAALTSLQAHEGRPAKSVRSVFHAALSALEKMVQDLWSGNALQEQPHILEQLLTLSLAAPEAVLDAEVGLDAPAELSPEQVHESDGLSGKQADDQVSVTETETETETGMTETASPLDERALQKFTQSEKITIHAVHDELHDIFIEEAADLMPQLDQQLRMWINEPLEDAAPVQMLRILHTLKGSARMAGELALGDALHRMEQTVAELARQMPPDAAALRALEATLDQLLLPFVAVNPATPTVVDDARTIVLKLPIDASGAAADTAADNSRSEPQAFADLSTAPPPEKVPVSLQLRVRADFLDRITHSGAELLVGSSRMANELQLQRQSVSDLSDNLGRLRSQLRELDMHAESRIASGDTQNTTAEFDPLEFDRYTRLHELTRMMAESIADISSLQRTLSRQLDNAALTVAAQGRYARGLQSDLRRVRTLPFASLTGRLQHLLRQVARDKGCEAMLDIDGGNVEIDRAVLDRMTGPLEHLLRNALAHGIETTAERQSQGKPAVGRVRIVLSQQGNSLLLQMSDDGRGLDYQRIRQRAIALGWLKPDADLDETALSALIFEPGFSTANEVTELSGRGIGMDAVRAAVLALGGQLKVSSQSGAGTCFMLSLPLTLATMQVVLVTAGSRDVAIPATLVQQMLQLSSTELVQARTTGVIEWQGRSLPLHRLAGLLGEPVADTEIAHRTPVAVLRQLDHYLAIELEAVTGHREVVVKNLGPQLAQVPGLAGATVLGDGSITLIINPLPLPEFAATQAHHPGIEMLSDTRARQLPRILVVDDSLTVRRSSQRLLERHGYAVALARDGLDALEQLRLHLPAAILLDIEMPRMDGFELLTALRDDPRWRDLPVAMITSRTAERHREHAMKLGATAYLGKPFVEEELLGLLTQWLASKSAEPMLDLG